jgi:hypothetical protein
MGWQDAPIVGGGWQDAPVVESPKKAPLSGSERFGMGLADPIHGGAQLLTKMLPQGLVQAGNRANNWLADNTGLVARLPEGGVDEAVRLREADYNQRKPEGMDWMRFAGNVASPTNIALGAAAAPARAASLGVKMAAGAGAGAAGAALAPVTDGDNFAKDKAQQMMLGGAFGAFTPVAVAGFSSAISPKASTDAGVALLKESGVRPTVGQTLGGWANRAEEKAQSLPIVGDAIAAARRRAVDQLNTAAINRATSPIGVKVDKIGQEGIKEAGDALSQAYDDVLSGLKSIKFDGQWRQDFGQLKTLAKGLPGPVRGTFNNKVRTLIEDRISPAGGMTSQTMKELDSELGQMARRYGRSSVASEQELGDAFMQAQALLRDQVGRNSPAAAGRLKDINTGWANLVRVEAAGKSAINNEGVFSPAQLNMGIRQADKSTRGRSVSRGTALMQDLGNAGARLGNRVPNSGTADRLILGGAGLGAGLYDPLIPLSLGVGALTYTPPAQALLRGLVSSRPAAAQPIAGLLNKSAPMLGSTGGLLGLNVLE